MSKGKSKKKKFEVQDKVRIREISEYSNKYAGELGIVEKTFPRHANDTVYGVRLYDHTNKQSSTGLFWFEPKSLEKLTGNNTYTNDETENESEEIFMFDNFIVAEVEFFNNPAPAIPYALYDTDVEVDDTVVVATAHHGFTLAKVVSISLDVDKKKEVKHGREIVCRVDFKAYNERKEVAERISTLNKEMEERMKDVQRLAVFEAMAEKDEKMKGMLEEYKTLMGFDKK